MKKISANAVCLLLAFIFFAKEGDHKKGNEDKSTDLLHGTWVTRYANGNPCDSGKLYKGIPDGTWQVWYPDGTLQFYRTYSADKWQRFQQEIVRYHPKRPSYPLTRLYHNDRGKAESLLSQGISFCNSSACIRHAETIEERMISNTAGGEYHPLFEKGMLHGLFVNYFKDGSIKDSGFYSTGLRANAWVHWSSDQKGFWKGAYLNGMKDREWKYFSAEGILLHITYYKRGKEIWSKEMQRLN